jgi:hypothetical protein
MSGKWKPKLGEVVEITNSSNIQYAGFKFGRVVQADDDSVYLDGRYDGTWRFVRHENLRRVLP